MPGRGNRLGRRRPAFGSGHVSSAGLAPTFAHLISPARLPWKCSSWLSRKMYPTRDEAKADVFDSLSGSIIPSADSRRSILLVRWSSNGRRDWSRRVSTERGAGQQAYLRAKLNKPTCVKSRRNIVWNDEWNCPDQAPLASFGSRRESRSASPGLREFGSCPRQSSET